MIVNWTLVAQMELFEVWRHIALDNPVAADGVARAVARRFAAIGVVSQDRPLRGGRQRHANWWLQIRGIS